jgi:FkbM family methyltransferase
MRIAVIDGVNQDIGLNILFSEADYFINNTELDKSSNMLSYNIIPNYDWSQINDTNYDYLFIVIALYDAKPGTKFFKQNIYDILQKEIKIINENNFKKVFVFDNYDYDYDPNEIISNEKISLFFKRNYNKTKIYKNNVVPFPFIMFGEVSIIEKLENSVYFEDKINRVFFTGGLFVHDDPQINYYRDRRTIYSKIQDYIYNPGYLNYNDFLQVLRTSKFSLDLNGVGDPNKRTFEILSQGSLMLSQYNDLKWPFGEQFSEETVFKNESEFIQNVTSLNNDNTLYTKCLDNQLNIYNKYFNKKWIKEYILKYINIMYYSQCGEDEFLNNNYFKNKRDGVFIELGALDGVLYSNTKFFEDNLNWKGILIEPHPYKFKELVNNRPKNYLFNNLVSCSTEELLFKFFVDNYSGVSGVENTLPKEHLSGFYTFINEPQGSIFIKPKTLAEIVKSSDIKHIDLLSLDVEGHEYEVLMSWDFSVPIDVILIETLGGSMIEKEEKCRDILIKNGYVFDTKYKHNEVFILQKN